MKKTLIALAALGAFAGAASAQSSVTLYGIIDLGLVKLDRADNSLALGGGVLSLQNKELNVSEATKSRIGLRGVEDLGGGLSAKFELEHRLFPDTGTQDGASFWDKSIVGLTSQTFGEINLGRDYMPAFYPQYLLDPWLNQGIAEMGASSYAWSGYLRNTDASRYGFALPRGSRYNNGIWYKLQAAGFTAIVGASLKEDTVLAAGVPPVSKNRYGFAVMYNNGPLMASVAYDQSEEIADRDEHVWFVGGAYDFGFVKPRLSYSTSQLNRGGVAALITGVGVQEVKPSTVTLAATFPVGTNLIKAGVTHLDFDFNDIKQTKFSLGYEHVLSKRTALYTDLTTAKTKGAVPAGLSTDRVTGFDLGIRHAF